MNARLPDAELKHPRRRGLGPGRPRLDDGVLRRPRPKGLPSGRPRIRPPTARAVVLAAYPEARVVQLAARLWRVDDGDGWLGAGGRTARVAWCSARDVILAR